MAFIDFAEVKEKVSFSDATQHLDLNMKRAGNQWRGECPVCGGSDRGLVITEGKGWYCWSLKKGGDVIALAAHILDLPAKDAAQELAQRAGIVPVPSTGSNTVRSRNTEPESEERGGSKLAPLAYLEPEHDAVIAIGFDPAVAQSLGIGYAPRGIMRGTVAVPIRDEHGALKGYIGITEATLPADFTTNVVPFKKTA